MSQLASISMLYFYGLDQILTDQDDPHLWEQAVVAHWPGPDDSVLRNRLNGDLLRFSFGVGSLREEETGSTDWSGMIILERWTCERVDDRHFRAVRGEPEYPHFILDISRPTVGSTVAWVHVGDNPAPLIGRGETLVWQKGENGNWTETDEIVAMWIS